VFVQQLATVDSVCVCMCVRVTARFSNVVSNSCWDSVCFMAVVRTGAVFLFLENTVERTLLKTSPLTISYEECNKFPCAIRREIL
jgi:hypothetical protein